jgi:kumamolisin
MAPKKTTPRFSTQSRTVLPGSEKAPLAQAAGERPAPPANQLSVSVLVRRKKPLTAAHRLGKQRLTRAQYRASHAADPAAVKLVRAFAAEFGLKVQPKTPSPESRIMKLTGSVAAMQKAFGVSLMFKTINGVTYRVREGGIDLPDEFIGNVEAVLGLDNRPQAQPHFRIANKQGAGAAQDGGFAKPHAGSSSSFTPVQAAQLYEFPQPSDATGQTIGIIELGGGFRTTDIATYFKALKQKTPSVVAVSVDGGKNTPSTANSADGEVMLDIEIAAAVAPGAKIVVYFAPNTDQGFIDAIGQAVHDTINKPSVISISWGSAEVNWTQQAMTAFDAVCQSAAALGITITAASGDDGSTDGVSNGKNNVDFPASTPYILACGGTKLEGSGSSITSEVVWNELANNEGAGGGGISDVFSLPSWQSNSNVPKPTTAGGGRGVPDVAGNADPTTGYQVRVDGKNIVIGGTSAVAPLMAGLIAVVNKATGKAAGFLNPLIYSAKGKAAFNDITSGTNYEGTPVGFKAGPGPDACSGLGSPIAIKLVGLLNGSSASPSAKQKGKRIARPRKIRPRVKRGI